MLAAVVLVPVIGWALPGDVVTAIAPRFDAPALESLAALDANGVVHLWPGAPPLDGPETAALDGTETGGIFRLAADGTTAAIPSPGFASSALSLPGGKWLVNGTRWILADGTADPSWHIPNLTRPASFSHLVPASEGGLLAVGDFFGLVKLAADGTPFPGFAADSRLGGLSALAVMPDDSVMFGLLPSGPQRFARVDFITS